MAVNSTDIATFCQWKADDAIKWSLVPSQARGGCPRTYCHMTFDHINQSRSESFIIIATFIHDTSFLSQSEPFNCSSKYTHWRFPAENSRTDFMTSLNERPPCIGRCDYNWAVFIGWRLHLSKSGLIIFQVRNNCLKKTNKWINFEGEKSYEEDGSPSDNPPQLITSLYDLTFEARKNTQTNTITLENRL